MIVREHCQVGACISWSTPISCTIMPELHRPVGAAASLDQVVRITSRLFEIGSHAHTSLERVELNTAAWHQRWT